MLCAYKRKNSKFSHLVSWPLCFVIICVHERNKYFYSYHKTSAKCHEECLESSKRFYISVSQSLKFLRSVQKQKRNTTKNAMWYWGKSLCYTWGTANTQGRILMEISEMVFNLFWRFSVWLIPTHRAKISVSRTDRSHPRSCYQYEK